MHVGTRHSHQIIKSFEAQALKKRPWHLKVADSLTVYFGTVAFLIGNLALFAIWAIINLGVIPGIPVFDPFPYFLLTTIVSLEAITLTIIVLVSQNRQAHVSTLREELQLQVNLIAEREITEVLRLVKKIADKENIKVESEVLTEMLKDTDTSFIERKLEEQLIDQPLPLIKELEKKVTTSSRELLSQVK